MKPSEKYLKMISDLNPPKKKRVEHEAILQTQCVDWFKIKYPKEVFGIFHIPNGGTRKRVQDKKGVWFSPEANRLKRMGTKAKIPDLFIPIPRGGFNGYFIEMKANGKKPDKGQKAAQEYLRGQGYLVSVIDDLEIFISEVTLYMSGKIDRYTVGGPLQ